jgi:signal transduction histidine kinase
MASLRAGELIGGRDVPIQCGQRQPTQPSDLLASEAQNVVEPVQSDVPELTQTLRAARLSVAFEGQPASLTLATMLATLTLAVLWPTGNAVLLLAWYATFIVVTLARVWLFRAHRGLIAKGTPQQLERLQSRFVLSCCAAGASWGLACLTVFPSEPLHRMFLSFALAGVAAAAVTSLSALRGAALGFVLLSTGPLAARLLTASSDTDLAMGLMVLMFLLVVSVSIARLDAQLLALVRSRMEADGHLRVRAQQQEQMQALNDRLHLAIAASKAGVFEWDVTTSTIGCDAHMRELYDLRDEGSFSYEVWRQRLHPHDLARIEAALDSALKGRDTLDEEFRVLWSDGTERFVRFAAIVQRDGDGNPVRVVGLNFDTTALRRVDRMKSEFVSMVSHELRTPLTSIRASLGLLSNGSAGAITSKAQNLVQLAGRNAERLNVLIDDILDIDKIESGKLRFDLAPQPLLPLVEQAISVNAVYASTHRVELRLAPCEEQIIVAVDANRLLQVMTNLLSNAVKFSKPDRHVDLIATADATRATIEVRDYGPGIAPDFQANIFTKFSQGDSSDTRSKGGSGLGLAISKALIERMNGRIDFRTMPGHGTSFFIDLPVRAMTGSIEDAERTTVVLPVSL